MSRLLPLLSLEQREQLIAAARRRIGLPFLHQGRTDNGADCIGFAGLILADIGIALPPLRTDYGRTPSAKKLESELVRFLGEPIPLVSMEPGDIVSMKWFAESNHIGLVTPHPERRFGLIHSYKNATRVIEHGMDSIWLSRITGVYRT